MMAHEKGRGRMHDSETARFSRPDRANAGDGAARGATGARGGDATASGHGTGTGTGAAASAGERVREWATAAATRSATAHPSVNGSASDSTLLIPISSPLVRRLALLVVLGVVMTLSSSVALAAAASLARSPTSGYLRSAASAAAAAASPAVFTAPRDQLQAMQAAVTSHASGTDKMQTLLDLYCRGSLLHDVQVNHVFADSKHFVDMPVKSTSSAATIPAQYREYLAQIGPQWMLMEQKERILLLKVFLDQHFDSPGSDMVPVVPHDYQEETRPSAIAAIANPAFQEWAFQLHKLWKLLGRVPQENVTSSFLHATPVAHPEMQRTQNVLVVPGGRFRESYYWDSYWIVEGLLVSGMKRTARGVVNNLLEYVAEFGFVPNGGRIYYLTRSQPPLLSDMVKLIAEAGKPDATDGSNAAKAVDLEYLRAVVPILEKEYAFWMQLGPSSHAVEIEAVVRKHPHHGHHQSGHHHHHQNDHHHRPRRATVTSDIDYDHQQKYDQYHRTRRASVTSDGSGYHYQNGHQQQQQNDQHHRQRRASVTSDGSGHHHQRARRASFAADVAGRDARRAAAFTADASGDAEAPKRYILNRYVAHADEPRPESYREDFHDATLAFKHTHGLDASDVAAKKSQLYNDIIAAAESGWDFTSRWLKDGKSMETADTSNVVPVDLNVMMHRFETNLAHFHALLGDTHSSALFTRAAATRAEAIQTLLWSPKTQSWHDYLLDSQSHSPIVSVSNYAPLWADGLVNTTDAEAVENIVESLRSSGLIQVGGIQATTVVTGQQWDGPNAWPPSQDMVIEGLLALKASKQAQQLARECMRTWVKAGYVAWQKTGLMFEKYNATTLGGIGNGGEYIPQFGFGWTNGVILKYLAKHQDKLVGVEDESIDSARRGNDA